MRKRCGYATRRCWRNGASCHELRRAGDIDDDVFHELEQELDWKQLAASPQGSLDMVEG